MMKIFLLSLLSIISLVSITKGQDAKAEKILASTKAKFLAVHDFRARVEIKVDVDFIQIPVKYATVIFKFPDKFKFRGDGFLLIPKKGLNFSIYEILETPQSSIYMGLSEMNGRKIEEIRIIPSDRKNDLILATLFIDSQTSLVNRVEAHTKESGFYSADFIYPDANYPLPSEIRITFEIEKSKFPMKYLGDMQMENKDLPEKTEATVQIRYTDYQVNTGVPDSLFVDDPGQK